MTPPPSLHRSTTPPPRDTRNTPETETGEFRSGLRSAAGRVMEALDSAAEAAEGTVEERDAPPPRLAPAPGSRALQPSEGAADAIALKDMQEMFDAFDDDHGGTIEGTEFVNHLNDSLGFSLEHSGLESLFDAVDGSGNGHIDRDEWAIMMRSILHKLEKTPPTPDDVRRALKAVLLPIDHRGAARVSLAAIQPGFAKLGVRLTTEQATGVMLSALDLCQDPESPGDLGQGYSANGTHNTADGPLLEDVCDALSSLLRTDNVQTRTRSTVVAADDHGKGSPGSSLALFGAPIAHELDDVNVEANLGLLLQMVPLFANLDDRKFSRLTEICQRSETRYKKGDAIVKQGEVGHELFLLLSGTAFASVYSDEHGKKPTIVKNYTKGDYFGERALFRDDGKRAANIFVSSEDALCCKISRQEFHDLIEDLDRSAVSEAGATDVAVGGTETGHEGQEVESWRQQVSDVDAIEQWRTLVRRFLWLDMLHDMIDDQRTLKGHKKHTQSEADIRHEISKRFFFFAPDAPFVNQWQLFQVLVLVITAIIVPLRAGFDQIDTNDPVFWFTFDLISDLYFWVDIVLNFRTAYFDNQQNIEHNDRKVAWNYATGWFIIDFSSVVPVSYILYIMEPSSVPWRALDGGDSGSAGALKLLKILRLFRLTKMLKLLKMKELLEKHEDNELLTRFMGSVTLITLFIQLLYMCHFLACFFYLFGDISESTRPDGTVIHGWVRREQWGAYGWAGRYLYSFFLSITDETSGLAETDAELLWSGMQHILYEAFLAYLTGVFAGEVISGNAAQQEYTAKMDQVKYFMHHYQLPYSLRKQVNAFCEILLGACVVLASCPVVADEDLQFLFPLMFPSSALMVIICCYCCTDVHLNDTKTFFDEEAVLSEFPPAIRKQVIYHIYKTFVDDHSVKMHYPFLSRLPERLRYELCRVLKPLAAVRGDVIYAEGEYGDEMYLVANGQCVAYKWTGDVADHKRKLHERNQTIYATGQIEEGLTLHVRGIGGSTPDPGVYEDVQALRMIFEAYGTFRDAVIRHRVDEETGKNTSWALVTMCDVESAQRVLEAAAIGGVLRPDGVKLQVNPFSSAAAKSSTGAMRRTTDAVQILDSHVQDAMNEGMEDQANFGSHHPEYGERLGEFNDGSFFGEEALLGENVKRIATVVAVANGSHIWYLDRAACSSFSRQEDVRLFYKELRSFARKRQRLNELRAKRMAQLDLRLATLKKEFSIAQMLAGGRLPAEARIPSTEELPMINSVFSPLVLGDVRDAVKFRCVALDFEKGDAIQSVFSAHVTTRKSALEGGVLVLVRGELLASVVSEAGRDAVVQPGTVFSGSALVKKVKKFDPVDNKQESALLPHPKGMHVSGAVVTSERASALWLDNRLFEFAHDPNSLEITFGEEDSSDDNMSDDEDDTTAGEAVPFDMNGAQSPLPKHSDFCKLQTQMRELKHDMDEKMQRLEQANATMQQELTSKLDALLLAMVPASPLHERLHAAETQREEPEPELESEHEPQP